MRLTSSASDQMSMLKWFVLQPCYSGCDRWACFLIHPWQQQTAERQNKLQRCRHWSFFVFQPSSFCSPVGMNKPILKPTEFSPKADMTLIHKDEEQQSRWWTSCSVSVYINRTFDSCCAQPSSWTLCVISMKTVPVEENITYFILNRRRDRQTGSLQRPPLQVWIHWSVLTPASLLPVKMGSWLRVGFVKMWRGVGWFLILVQKKKKKIISSRGVQVGCSVRVSD